MAYIGTPAAPVATVVGDNAVTTRSIAPNAVTPPKLANSGSELSFRNRIINGDMRIDQRNAGASVTPAAAGTGAYTLDRWNNYASQASKYTVQQNSGSVTPPAGFSNYIGVVSSSAYSITATDIFLLRQLVEGYNVADFGWGAASAQAVTLSFWVRSSLTGTFGGSFQNAAQDRNYPFSYTIIAANTWEQKTVTIPGDTTGTWLKTNGVGVQVNFSLGVGSTYSGTANAWASGGPFWSATGAVNLISTLGATFYITGVQLEAGTVATPFERRDYGRELMMCQRYFEVFNSSASALAIIVYGANQWATWQFKQSKRVSPTITGATSGPLSMGIEGVRSDGVSSAYASFGYNGASYGACYASSEL